MMKQETERIILEKVSKKFKIGSKKKQTALSHFISLFSGVEPKREFWALKDISFRVKAGENLGIIGKNGCGKTTLLAAIAGIYRLDGGKIKINGKITLLSGMATGLKPRLTIKDNIFLVGSILGLSQKDIRKNLNSIIEFAGLEDFVNTKIYQLSSGMKSRLAFSISMDCIEHSKPDILLLDEVFSGGGDEEFKDKALKKMEGLVKSGTTIVLASHRTDVIKKYCDRAIWLDKGKIMEEGKPTKVIEAYLNFVKRTKNRRR